jgi:predicted HicB family RNase H-like nuclease
MNLPEYRGYEGSVSYDAGDRVFYGKVAGIRALVSYEGTDVEGLETAFREAVDDYLQLCAERGAEPERPFKGSFNVRTRPELHRKAVQFATEHGTNLNTVVTDALESYLKERGCG